MHNCTFYTSSILNICNNRTLLLNIKRNNTHFNHNNQNWCFIEVYLTKAVREYLKKIYIVDDSVG